MGMISNIASFFSTAKSLLFGPVSNCDALHGSSERWSVPLLLRAREVLVFETYVGAFQ
jgi:hypothetical protein